jgi:isopentenyldiphosphate isomerase
MEPSKIPDDFLQHLQEEKLQTQKTRENYTLKKLAYATALLGIGSFKLDKIINLNFLLFFVPFVALVFDFYILGEDYSIKRIGAFLSKNSNNDLEQQWENWVSQNRDPFAPIAMSSLTTLLLIGSALIINHLNSEYIKNPLFWIWLFATGALNWFIFCFYKYLRQKVKKNMIRKDKEVPLSFGATVGKWFGLRIARSVESQAKNFGEITEQFRSIQRTVTKSGYIFTKEIYYLIKSMFINCRYNPQFLEDLEELTPEYAKAEFFYCVDGKGNPGYPAAGMDDIIENFKATTEKYQEFNNWFQVDANSNGPTLLIARWLCHLVGLRHQAVHLFIEHPVLQDYMLIQTRSSKKFESPNCLDIPAAGHVSGLASIRETLFTELHEELNLDQTDITEPIEVNRYHYITPASHWKIQNTEFRIIYRCYIKESGFLKIKFIDDEVAAINILPVQEVKELLKKSPDKIASGLMQSFPKYLKARCKNQPK